MRCGIDAGRKDCVCSISRPLYDMRRIARHAPASYIAYLASRYAVAYYRQVVKISMFYDIPEFRASTARKQAIAADVLVCCCCLLPLKE